jgi:Tfp pilus assembly protein PilF
LDFEGRECVNEGVRQSAPRASLFAGGLPGCPTICFRRPIRAMQRRSFALAGWRLTSVNVDTLRTILWRCCGMAILLLTCPARQIAQFEPANPVQLVVNVFIGSLQNPASANVTVQLLDRFGSLEKEQHTDSSGRVEFHTVTATKRLRVFGPGIEEHTEVLDIESVETRKMVRVTVMPKTGGSADLPNVPGSGSVSAARLSVPEKAQKEFRKGSEATEKKDWAQAKDHFEAAIAIYPAFDVAYNGLGVALSGMGDVKSARTAFEKAIGLNNNFAEAYRNLARIALKDRNYEEVDKLLTRSLSAEPLNAWALTYAAYAELQLHNFEGAIAWAHKAHSVPHVGLASVHIVAGLALEAEHRPAEAIEEYRTYLTEDPTGQDAARAREKVSSLN